MLLGCEHQGLVFTDEIHTLSHTHTQAQMSPNPKAVEIKHPIILVEKIHQAYFFLFIEKLFDYSETKGKMC